MLTPISCHYRRRRRRRYCRFSRPTPGSAIGRSAARTLGILFRVIVSIFQTCVSISEALNLTLRHSHHDGQAARRSKHSTAVKGGNEPTLGIPTEPGMGIWEGVAVPDQHPTRGIERCRDSSRGNRDHQLGFGLFRHPESVIAPPLGSGQHVKCGGSETGLQIGATGELIAHGEVFQTLGCQFAEDGTVDRLDRECQIVLGDVGRPEDIGVFSAQKDAIFPNEENYYVHHLNCFARHLNYCVNHVEYYTGNREECTQKLTSRDVLGAAIPEHCDVSDKRESVERIKTTIESRKQPSWERGERCIPSLFLLQSFLALLMSGIFKRPC